MSSCKMASTSRPPARRARARCCRLVRQHALQPRTRISLSSTPTRAGALNCAHLSTDNVPAACCTAIFPPNSRSWYGVTVEQSRTNTEVVCTRSWYTSHRAENFLEPWFTELGCTWIGSSRPCSERYVRRGGAPGGGRRALHEVGVQPSHQHGFHQPRVFRVPVRLEPNRVVRRRAAATPGLAPAAAAAAAAAPRRGRPFPPPRPPAPPPRKPASWAAARTGSAPVGDALQRAEAPGSSPW